MSTQAQAYDPYPAPYPGQMQYSESVDQIENYGSIIKELTDTEALLEQLRLDILGKRIEDGQEKQVRNVQISEEKVYQFINLVKGFVNQNTHFTRYSEETVHNQIMAANYHINRFLMLQGADIPLSYRANIATQAISLISASLHKAEEGNILKWTKGSFSEGRQMNEGQKKKGMLDFIFRRGK